MSDSSRRTAAALPHLPNVEAGVLGSCLANHQYWPVAESLDRDAVDLFYEPNHRRVAEAMHRLYEAGRVVNSSAVQDALRATGQDLDGGTREFLIELSLHASTTSEIEFKDSIQSLGESRALRRIATMASDVSMRARGGEEPPADLTAAMLDIVEAGSSTGQAIATLGERLKVEHTAAFAVPTGLNDLDRILDGWQAGRLYALAARPKVGKTALALNATIAALAEGVPVLMFSLEMTARELYGRLLSCASFVPLSDLKDFLAEKGTLEHLPIEQQRDVEETVAALSSAPLYVVEAPEVRGTHDVQAAVVDFRSRHPEGPALVIVDYVQLMVHNQREQSSEIANITRELKLMSQRADLPVLALSQINRDGADADSGMPRPHQMRGSGAIEQDSDVVILMNRKSQQDPDHPPEDTDIWVALSRYCSPGWVKAHFHVDTQVIADVNGDDVNPDGTGGAARSSSREASAPAAEPRVGRSSRDSDRETQALPWDEDDEPGGAGVDLGDYDEEDVQAQFGL